MRLENKLAKTAALSTAIGAIALGVSSPENAYSQTSPKYKVVVATVLDKIAWIPGETNTVYVLGSTVNLIGAKTGAISWTLRAPTNLTLISAELPTQNDFFAGKEMEPGVNYVGVKNDRAVKMKFDIYGNPLGRDGVGAAEGGVLGMLGVYKFRAEPSSLGQQRITLGNVAVYADSAEGRDLAQPYHLVHSSIAVAPPYEQRTAPMLAVYVNVDDYRNVYSTGVPDKNQVLEGSYDLINWIPLNTNDAAGASVSFSDLPTPDNPARFYRSKIIQ